MKIAILGLTITSSWGNGHATTYRSLCKALHQRGHRIDFIERDVEWYRSHRDLPAPAFCTAHLYEDWNAYGRQLVLRQCVDADVVIVGSYFPDAVAASALLFESARRPVLFYDIDTPITLAALRSGGEAAYLRAVDIPRFAAYMSFTGGPVLHELTSRFGSPFAVPLYCSVDPAEHTRTAIAPLYRSDLSYLGTYAVDRQPKLMELLNRTAEQMPDAKFLVAGPQYPEETPWAENVRYLDHVGPPEHSSFYSSSRFTLNLTRRDMVEAGYSPSVRLFEASACEAAIISDAWPGLDTFLTPGQEVLLAKDASDVRAVLAGVSDQERRRIGCRARERILEAHTAMHRAQEFEAIVSRLR